MTSASSHQSLDYRRQLVWVNRWDRTDILAYSVPIMKDLSKSPLPVTVDITQSVPVCFIGMMILNSSQSEAILAECIE